MGFWKNMEKRKGKGYFGRKKQNDSTFKLKNYLLQMNIYNKNQKESREGFKRTMEN